MNQRLDRCEARKYLGVGDTSAGDPGRCCAHIRYRLTFILDDGEGGEARGPIAYFCREHTEGVIQQVNATEGRTKVIGLDVKLYRERAPKVEQVA